MTGAELVTIAGAATVLAVTPGPETILTIRLSALRRKAGLIYSLGSATGMTVWMIAALTGISALLTAYPSALVVLKVVGGLYLCFLGIMAARQAVKIRAELHNPNSANTLVNTDDSAKVDGSVDAASNGAGGTGDDDVPLGAASTLAAETEDLVMSTEVAGKKSWGQLRSIISYRRGLISSLSNPKAGLFFLAVLPTLLPTSSNTLDVVLLVTIVVGLLLTYQVILALASGMASAALQRRSTDFYIEATSTGVLVLMGIAVIAIPI